MSDLVWMKARLCPPLKRTPLFNHCSCNRFLMTSKSTSPSPWNLKMGTKGSSPTPLANTDMQECVIQSSLDPLFGMLNSGLDDPCRNPCNYCEIGHVLSDNSARRYN